MAAGDCRGVSSSLSELPQAGRQSVRQTDGGACLPVTVVAGLRQQGM